MMENNRSREQLLNSINEVSFAAYDMLLFLDTHPRDEKARVYFDEMIRKRRKLSEEYARMYGPLTIGDTVHSDAKAWQWMEQPFPWEKEGGCR